MFKNHPEVHAILNQRNESISAFWLSEPCARARVEPTFINRNVVIVDAEDTFTKMLAQQLSALGLCVEIHKSTEFNALKNNSDLILMGPGPGDPRNMNDNRIANLRTGLVHLLLHKRPFLAVCLSHQILCHELGLPLVRKTVPNQGVQREINFFGTQQRVGFYNTYAAQYNQTHAKMLQENAIEICRDAASDEIHALRGPHFCAMQFHPESLLTCNGVDILASCIKRIMPA